jgi:amino acid adenylation domain-containing protein
MTVDETRWQPRTVPAKPDSLADLFLAGLRADPSHVAFQVGEEQWSYHDLHTAALQVAGAVTSGAESSSAPLADGGAPVGVLAGPNSTAPLGILAAFYAGTAAVPLNPSFPVSQISRMIHDAGISTVIVDGRGERILREAGPGLLSGVRAISARTDGTHSRLLPSPELSAARPLSAPRAAAPGSTAYVMFTSGTTGRSKGVPVSHRNGLHFFEAIRQRHHITASDVIAQTFEPSFDLYLFSLFTGWSAGATVVATPPQILPKLPAFLEKHGVTLWFSVPSTIRLARRLGILSPGRLPTLSRSLFCGEALPRADALAWLRAAPNGLVENLYGPTELTIACSWHRLDAQETSPSSQNGTVPIGVLHPGLRYVLLGETGTVDGIEGELCVTGPQMFAGYLDSRDDAGRFIDHEGARWYRTGDRVRVLPDGALAYLGRTDQQVKVRGYRVEVLAVEHELRRLDGVEDCVVIVLADGDDAYLVAFFTGDRDAQTTLGPALAQRLLPHMVPRTFFWTRHIPLNANGKSDRPQLIRHAWARLRGGSSGTDA